MGIYASDNVVKSKTFGKIETASAIFWDYLGIGMSAGYPGPGISRDIPGSKNPGTKKSRDFDS